MLNRFFIILVAKVNTIVNPALTITTGAQTTVAWETIHTAPVAAEATIKTLSIKSKAVTYSLNFLLRIFFLINLWVKIIFDLSYFI